jgi:hypothetical protein
MVFSEKVFLVPILVVDFDRIISVPSDVPTLKDTLH